MAPLHGRLSIVLAFVLTSISTLVVVLRFYTRHFLVGKLTASDWVILLALIATWLSVVINIYMVRFMEYTPTQLQNPDTLEKVVTGSLLSIWLYRISHILDLCLIKTSILLFYHHIAASNRRFHYIIRTLLAIIILGGISMLFACIFMCYPVSDAWSFKIFMGGVRSYSAHCYNPRPFWLFNAVYNLVTDIIIWTLPILFFLNLQTIPLRRRIELIAIFSIGVVAIIASALRLHTIILWLSSFRQQGLHTADLLLWSQVEQHTGLIAASLPFLRPLCRKALTKAKTEEQPSSPRPAALLCRQATPGCSPVAMPRVPIIPSPTFSLGFPNQEFVQPRSALAPVELPIIRKCAPMSAMMTVGNALCGSGTVPSIPMPAPEPALDRLPIELLEKILDPYRDNKETLFTLRHTCCLFRLLTNKPLAPHLAKHLGHVRVFMTEEGLKTLLGLICIPEWKRYVRLVELVDPGVGNLRQDRVDKDQWFGYNIVPQLETIVKRVGPAQGAFYAEQAPGLMKEMFRLFKTMDALGEIRFGVRGDGYHPILGLKHMVRDIGFDRNSLALAPMHVTGNITSRDFGGHCLGGHASWLYKMLSDSNFDKRIITLDLYDRIHPGIWSLSQVWAALDHPSFRELRIFYRIPVPRANIIVPSWIVDLELTPGTFTLASTMSIETLTLVGSQGLQNYAANAETFALLTNTTFPNLTRLELRGYAVSGDQFVNLVESIQTTVRCMCLVGIHLVSGSWSLVFKALGECRELDRLGFRQLTGPGSFKGGDPVCYKSDPVLGKKWNVYGNRTGNKMMTEFLDLMGEYMLIAPDYKGDSNGESFSSFLWNSGSRFWRASADDG
ncbi:hypothetical protein PTNB85_06752 [Pyrenophora teres f. teres]|nr:hypothetical protein HRS9139_08015 [Pyrenophora teres f. teres]KAE8832360.1 hypothetical protein PTNB85_06752 [Pyrenophora teres f. teres]KAE8856022.1 hypothetical protein PTNB29_08861 [Pyrenophora teres f. teres]